MTTISLLITTDNNDSNNNDSNNNDSNNNDSNNNDSNNNDSNNNDNNDFSHFLSPWRTLFKENFKASRTHANFGRFFDAKKWSNICL